MSCRGCFNGCVETTSDKCIKYTGVDITFLDISNGDSLYAVEDKIISYLTTVLDGSGIIPTLPSSICDVVSGYLPSTGDITLNDVLTALIETACSLQSQIDDMVDSIAEINGDYDIDCLSDVEADDGTHTILQAVISQLCTLLSDFTTLSAGMIDYEKKEDLDADIAAYLAGVVNTKMYSRMVPYTVVEYYGELSGFPTSSDGFDLNGVGYGAWQKVYLCNGYNSLTPDKKGRIGIGVTTMGDTLDPILDHSFSLLDTYGTNHETLSTDQLAEHSHATTVSLTDPGHVHTVTASDDDNGNVGTYFIVTNIDNYGSVSTDSTKTGITTSVINPTSGSGLSHNNLPPVLACYYIMYIP